MDSAEPDMMVRNGARLALDLLADGVALDQPNFRRPLLRHALEQLDLGSDALDDRLSEVCDTSVSDIVTDVVSLKIRDGKSDSSMAAWKLLFQISQQGQTWADDLILQFCPDGPIDVELVDEIDFPLGSQRIADHLATLLSREGPLLGIRSHRFAQRLVSRHKREERVNYSRLRSMNFAPFYYGDAALRRECSILPGTLPTPYSVKVTSIRNADAFRQFDGPDFAGEAWSFVQSVRQFTETPSKRTLAACIRSSDKIPIAPAMQRALPWPLLTLLTEATDSESKKRLAIEIEIGLRGDEDQWLAAEERWESKGFLEDDFFANTETHWFDATIAQRGLPAWIDAYENVRYGNLPLARKLDFLIKAIKNKKIATMVSTSADIQILFGVRRDSWLEKDVDYILDKLSNSTFNFSHGFFQALTAVPSRLLPEPKIAKKIGSIATRMGLYELQLPAMRDLLFSAFDANPQLQELFYPVVLASLADEGDGRGRLKRIAATSGMNPSDSLLFAAILTAQLAESCSANQILDDLISIDMSQDLLLAISGSEAIPVSIRLNLLSALIKKFKERGSPKWRDYVSVARKALDSRKSDLTDHEIWSQKLQLPLESYGLLLPQAKAH